MLQAEKLVQFNDPAMLANPHAYMARLRDESPVVRASGPNGREFFLVTGYRLIEEVTKRADDFSNEIGHLLFAGGNASPEVEAILAQDDFPHGGLLTYDDPYHKRMRAIVNHVFAQGRIANLAPSIERIVDELIDDFIEAGECDFVNQFAVLLPTYMIADILGLDREDYPKVRTWSDAVIGIVSRMGSPELELANARMVSDFRRFIKNAISERREKPADDLISMLIAARLDGIEPLTDREIAPLTMEIAVAGNETTRNTLMSGLVQLLRHPDQLKALADDPALAPNTVEEMLRYETPATSMWRVATSDTTLGGVEIPKGSEVLLRYDSANRDPDVFEDADAFDIRRKNALRHISFGAPGVHRCLGQMLARKEMIIALPMLLARLHNIRIVAEKSDTDYWPGLLHRGIGGLHIAFDPQPRRN